MLEDFGVCNERGDETHAVVCLQLFVCIDRNMICFSFSMPAFFTDHLLSSTSEVVLCGWSKSFRGASTSPNQARRRTMMAGRMVFDHSHLNRLVLGLLSRRQSASLFIVSVNY